MSRRAGRSRPESTRACTLDVGSAVMRATGRPRSVMTISSPAAASATTRDAFCRRALMPMVPMCFKVARARRTRTAPDTCGATSRVPRMAIGRAIPNGPGTSGRRRENTSGTPALRARIPRRLLRRRRCGHGPRPGGRARPDDLPSPSTLSDGDVVRLEGTLLTGGFSLPERSASGEAGAGALGVAPGSVDVSCEAVYQLAEVFE